MRGKWAQFWSVAKSFLWMQLSCEIENETLYNSPHAIMIRFPHPRHIREYYVIFDVQLSSYKRKNFSTAFFILFQIRFYLLLANANCSLVETILFEFLHLYSLFTSSSPLLVVIKHCKCHNHCLRPHSHEHERKCVCLLTLNADMMMDGNEIMEQETNMIFPTTRYQIRFMFHNSSFKMLRSCLCIPLAHPLRSFFPLYAIIFTVFCMHWSVSIHFYVIKYDNGSQSKKREYNHFGKIA